MKKRYILNGFSTRELAQKRNHEFALNSGIKEDSTTKYMFNIHCLQREEWGLEVSEEHLNLLDDIERTSERLIEIPHTPFANAYVPMLFRYLELEWVDEFFKTGKLRLSSFKKFHKHDDEQRGDTSEGSNSIFGNSPDHHLFAVTHSGNDAFVLSTSLTFNEQLYIDFKVDSCFVIEKPLEFMDCIIRAIPEFKGINYGPCLYQPEKIIQRKIPSFNMDSIKCDENSNNVDMDKMFNLINQVGGNDVLFSKTIKYSNQHEYRILWHSFSDTMPDYIDVFVPEARVFCKQII